MSVNSESLSIEEIRRLLALRSRIQSFFESALLFALEDLGIFRELQEESATLQELAGRLDLKSSDLARILRPACAGKLLQRDPAGRFSIALEFRGLLDEQGPASVIPWIRFLKSVAPRLFSLSEVVRSKGRLELSETDYCLYGADFDSFTRAMQIQALTLGAELVRHVDLAETRSLLDAACGSGTYSLLLAKSYPELRVTLLDSARALEVARQNVEEMGLADRVTLQAGDILRDPLPGPFGCVLLSNALHLIGHGAARRLIRKVFESLLPAGTLIIQGQFLSGGPCEQSWPALLDLLLLCGSPEGENHSADQTEQWLREAGFVNIRFQPMSLFNSNSLVTGTRPG